MKFLITGADGFIGRALVQRLLTSQAPEEDSPHELALLDRHFASPPQDSRIRHICGDIANPEVLREARGKGVDCVFHLASVPGGAAEADIELGLRVNLHATTNLLEALRAHEQRTKFVFASSIAVYGVPLPDLIDEATVPVPTLSYGAQKLIGEILVTDYSRRGFIDGRSVRLPGIVARPHSAGMLSGFLSEIIRVLSAGGRFTCPVSADGMSWWMSRSRVVDNLLHAAALAESQQRLWMLPVLHASLGEVVAAIARVHGPEVLGRVTYQSNPTLQAQFANYPPLECPRSVAAGFRHDGTLDELVQRALEGP